MDLIWYVKSFFANATFLLFAVYGAAALRAWSSPAKPPIVRFLGLTVLAATVTMVANAWGQRYFGGPPMPTWTMVRLAGVEYAAMALTLGVVLRLEGCSWWGCAAPLVASTVAVLAAAGLVSLGTPRGFWWTLSWFSVMGVWHAVCALWLRSAVRIRREQRRRRTAEVCCSSCGYALTGLASPTQCPECGARFGGGVAESA